MWAKLHLTGMHVDKGITGDQVEVGGLSRGF